GLYAADGRDRFGDVVGVELRDVDWRARRGLHLLAALQTPRREVDALEDIAVHRAFLGDDGSRGTRTNDQNAIHRPLLVPCRTPGACRQATAPGPTRLVQS